MPDVNITWNESRNMRYLASRLLREWQDAVDSNPEFRPYGCMVRRYEKEFYELVREFDKEKLTPVGDRAKLRETLATIRKRLVAPYESEAGFMRYSPNSPLVDLIDAALAAPPRACDVMSQEDLTKVVISGFMKSLGIGPENQLVSQLAEAAISAAIKCAYDTQMVTKEGGAK